MSMFLEKTEARGGKAVVCWGFLRFLNVDGIAVKVMTVSSRRVIAHAINTHL